ncbi:MAG: DUF1080 domain-containing protein, partial [Gemmataceae bacterium]|nr:DUF1080 domain-containing protein [Gemmataceae bacterium]
MIALVLLAFAADDKGWLSLFDGETTTGWKIEGEAKVEKGKLVLGGTKATKAVSSAHVVGCKARLQYERDPDTPETLWFMGEKIDTTTDPKLKRRLRINSTAEADQACPPFRFEIPAGAKVILSKAEISLVGLSPLFDGKTLAGWQPFKGDPKRERSAFTAKEGVLAMKGGPGDLATEKLLDDFVLQLECRTNGKHLNSGVFFRAIPGEYQNGYECQIHNDFTLDPPKKHLVG